MLSLGLSAAEQRLFERDLIGGHGMRVGVRLLDLDHNLIGILTGRVLSGQVDVDVTAEVSRSLSLEVRDDDNSLGLDSGAPTSSGMYADRMLSVVYGVWCPSLGRWVDVPVFTGPITGLQRAAGTLSVTAQGKESLMLGPCCYTTTFQKGSRKTDIVRSLFDAAGESRLEIPAWPDKITAPMSIASTEVPWAKAQALAYSLGGAVLAYDGRGDVRLRKFSSTNVWTFGSDESGSGGGMLTEPSLQYDQSTVRNLVVVAGGTPKGAKKPVVAQAVAQASHPFSPQSLGRGAPRRPRFLREDLSDDSVTTVKAAQELAASTLAQRLSSAIDVSFESMVIPHLEPRDVVTVRGGSWVWPMQMQKFTIPLTVDGRMSVGRHTVVSSVVRRKVKRR